MDVLKVNDDSEMSTNDTKIIDDENNDIIIISKLLFRSVPSRVFSLV